MRIPDLDRLAIRPGRDAAAVVGEHYRGDWKIMALQRLQAGAGLRIPDLDRVVVRPGRDAAAVVGEHHGGDKVVMAF